MRHRLQSVGIVGAGIITLVSMSSVSGEEWKLESPNGRVALAVRSVPAGDSPRLHFEVACGGRILIEESPLGISCFDAEFLDGLVLERAGAVSEVDSSYLMPHGKRRECRTRYREQTLTFRAPEGGLLALCLRVADDGAAFRYLFPEESASRRLVMREHTGFRLPAAAVKWAHPYDDSGEYTPAYETYYEMGVPAGAASPKRAGWAYPILFRAGESGPWGLIAESGLDGTYCGTRLDDEADGAVWRVRFPDEAEGDGTGRVPPASRLPWTMPWRVVIASEGLGGIVESTLVQDLGAPSVLADASWIRPGRVSWSWLVDHDSPQDCVKLKRFVDLAADMGWEYSLVDANWTHMKNGGIRDLADYARSRGVGLILWYNSGGPHNHVSERPRGLLDRGEIRRKEFQILRDWGVKGVKVDFFQSDKQGVIGLYLDILRDAAEFQLLVDFHGCTLPRGWSRTYPNLVSMEAVRGAECYSFDSSFPAKAPAHNVLAAFARNVVGPMDYTPVVLDDNVYPHVTTWAHELALAVVFESGLLHFGDGPAAYAKLSGAALQYLKDVPAAWDDTRFVSGEPGRHVVLARRRGDEWFLAGINALDSRLPLSLDLGFLAPGTRPATLIEDGAGARATVERQVEVSRDAPLALELHPFGGFVARIRN